MRENSNTKRVSLFLAQGICSCVCRYLDVSFLLLACGRCLLNTHLLACLQTTSSPLPLTYLLSLGASSLCWFSHWAVSVLAGKTAAC